MFGEKSLSALSGRSFSVAVGIIINHIINLIYDCLQIVFFSLYWTISIPSPHTLGDYYISFQKYQMDMSSLSIHSLDFGRLRHSKLNTIYWFQGDPTTIKGTMLSLVSLYLSVPVAWVPSATDCCVYQPSSTPEWKSFALRLLVFALFFSFINSMGVHLSSNVLNDSL